MFPIGIHRSVFFELVPPVVNVDANEVLGIVGKAITLNCRADGYPFPTISWTRRGHAIDHQPGKKIVEESIRIHSFR